MEVLKVKFKLDERAAYKLSEAASPKRFFFLLFFFRGVMGHDNRQKPSAIGHQSKGSHQSLVSPSQSN